MKPWFHFVILLFLILQGCKEKQVRSERKPDWVLSEEKMSAIITDLRIADAATYINANSPPRDKAKDWYFIMKKHQVVDSVFRNSHDYYAGHPEIAEKIYEKVIDNISEMQADYVDGQ